LGVLIEGPQFGAAFSFWSTDPDSHDYGFEQEHAGDSPVGDNAGIAAAL
jgi:hypothetical protein